ncbi:MAG: pyruvate formate lyase family protein [Planctomycetota bacterium]|jgi:formate C-acetyltransferase
MIDVVQTTSRVQRLRGRMFRSEHIHHRVKCPDDWSVTDMDCSLPERKAHALKRVCEEMPIVIEPEELIVGSRAMILDNDESVWGPILPKHYRDEADGELRTHSRATTHDVPGFQKVIGYGIGELAEMSRRRLEGEADQAKQEFLKSFILACEAISTYCRRYARRAVELAGETDDPQRQKELATIADVCEHVATERPRHLHDALQLYWFTWLVSIYELGCLVSVGRFDQIVEPFWPEDPAEQNRAQELLDCFLVKCNDQNDLWKGASLVNNTLMLSGLKPDGADGTNAVTWAVLDGVGRLNLADPQPAVRLHKGSPPELVRRVGQLWRNGIAQISVFNDDVFAEAMTKLGFPAVDARDYAIDACQDVNIAGKSVFYLAASIPMCVHLLETLNSAPDDADWETFYGAYKEKLAKEIEAALVRHAYNVVTYVGDPCPFLSVTMDDCIETGLDVANGGLRYRDKGAFMGEPVCAINSLAAVRKVIYEDGVATLGELRDACEANFEGYEELRGKLQEAPKWGNDDDDVDLIGKDIVEFACHEINRHRMEDGSRFLAGVHQAHHVAVGSGLKATPDGRRDGDPLAPTMAAAGGTERRGPTAVMRSATKIDPMCIQWNFSLTMTFDPTSLAGETGLDNFAALIRTYIAMRGPQLQVNCVDGDTLRAAQADPEAYSDLVVRVWGFCDRFITLAPEYQEEIISRTAHCL